MRLFRIAPGNAGRRFLSGPPVSSVIPCKIYKTHKKTTQPSVLQSTGGMGIFMCAAQYFCVFFIQTTPPITPLKTNHEQQLMCFYTVY
jgi:hypothetical protein